MMVRRLPRPSAWAVEFGTFGAQNGRCHVVFPTLLQHFPPPTMARSNIVVCYIPATNDGTIEYRLVQHLPPPKAANSTAQGEALGGVPCPDPAVRALRGHDSS